MATLAQRERAALADLLEEVGPDAPTLCEGWTARDLAAHLVLREGNPLAAAGIVLPPFAGLTSRVQSSYASRPFERLVQQIRNGPPRLSPFSLPGVDAAANAMEYYIHHEDVRRAAEDWTPRSLPPKAQDTLWRLLPRIAKTTQRRAPFGVVLERPNGDTIIAKQGNDAVTVRGEPSELAMFVYGRQAHADVSLQGDPAHVAKLTSASFGI